MEKGAQVPGWGFVSEDRSSCSLASAVQNLQIHLQSRAVVAFFLSLFFPLSLQDWECYRLEPFQVRRHGEMGLDTKWGFGVHAMSRACRSVVMVSHPSPKTLDFKIGLPSRR